MAQSDSYVHGSGIFVTGSLVPSIQLYTDRQIQQIAGFMLRRAHWFRPVLRQYLQLRIYTLYVRTLP